MGRAVVVTVACLASAVVGSVRAFRPGTNATDRGVAIAAALLLLAGIFTPFQIPGWQAFSQRFVPLGVALAFAVAPLELLPPRVRAVAPLSLFAAAAAFLGLSYPFHHRLVGLCPDAVAGLVGATVQTRGELFPLVLRDTEGPTYDVIHAEVPLLTPLLHMGTAYATALGGVPAVSFNGGAAIHAFTKVPDPRPLPDVEHYRAALASRAFSHDLAFRDRVESEIATYGMYYEEVVVFGTIPSDVALWRERGFAVDWKGATTLLAHFEPCTIDVSVAAAAADPAPTFDVEVGIDKVIVGARPTAVMEGLTAHFVLPTAPCGKVGVRAKWEHQGGAATFCRNADTEGRVLAKISRTSGAVDCEE